MEKKRNRRPLSPFRMPEGGLDTLKRIYETDEWNGEKGIRSIIQKAYTLYKTENPKAADLPDTFDELMELDPKDLPSNISLSLTTKANEVWDDTIHAQATLDFADGKEPKEEPQILYDLSFDREDGKEPESMSDKAILNAKNTDFFTKPEQSAPPVRLVPPQRYGLPRKFCA